MRGNGCGLTPQVRGGSASGIGQTPMPGIVLAALNAWTGGAPMLRATLRVTFWGAFAMAATAAIGALVGHAV